MSRQRVDRRTRVLHPRPGLGLLAATVVLGEAGHVVLDQIPAVVAHYFLHIIFPLTAFTVLGVFVARDIRAHGWPALWLLAAG